jgi:hypothetical protein
MSASDARSQVDAYLKKGGSDMIPEPGLDLQSDVWEPVARFPGIGFRVVCPIP